MRENNSGRDLVDPFGRVVRDLRISVPTAAIFGVSTACQLRE